MEFNGSLARAVTSPIDLLTLCVRILGLENKK